MITRRPLLEAADAIAAAIRSGLSLSLLSVTQAADLEGRGTMQRATYVIGLWRRQLRRAGLVLFANGAKFIP